MRLDDTISVAYIARVPFGSSSVRETYANFALYQRPNFAAAMVHIWGRDSSLISEDTSRWYRRRRGLCAACAFLRYERRKALIRIVEYRPSTEILGERKLAAGYVVPLKPGDLLVEEPICMQGAARTTPPDGFGGAEEIAEWRIARSLPGFGPIRGDAEQTDFAAAKNLESAPSFLHGAPLRPRAIQTPEIVAVRRRRFPFPHQFLMDLLCRSWETDRIDMASGFWCPYPLLFIHLSQT